MIDDSRYKYLMIMEFIYYYNIGFLRSLVVEFSKRVADCRMGFTIKNEITVLQIRAGTSQIVHIIN